MSRVWLKAARAIDFGAEHPEGSRNRLDAMRKGEHLLRELLAVREPTVRMTNRSEPNICRLLCCNPIESVIQRSTGLWVQTAETRKLSISSKDAV